MRDVQEMIIAVVIITLLLMCCFCTGLTMQLAWREARSVAPLTQPTPTDLWNIQGHTG